MSKEQLQTKNNDRSLYINGYKIAQIAVFPCSIDFGKATASILILQKNDQASHGKMATILSFSKNTKELFVNITGNDQLYNLNQLMLGKISYNEAVENTAFQDFRENKLQNLKFFEDFFSDKSKPKKLVGENLANHLKFLNHRIEEVRDLPANAELKKPKFKALIPENNIKAKL